MQVAASNSNGRRRVELNTGTIDAADIEPPEPLTTRTFNADTDFSWPWVQATRAMVTIVAGDGGGAGGAGGGAGFLAVVKPALTPYPSGAFY